MADTDFGAVGFTQLLATRGTAVVYQEDGLGKDPVTLTAVVGQVEARDEVAESAGLENLYRVAVRFLRYADSEFGGVADPKVQAVITIDGVRWAIDRIEAMSGAVVSVTCVRGASTSHTSDPQRGRMQP